MDVSCIKATRHTLFTGKPNRKCQNGITSSANGIVQNPARMRTSSPNGEVGEFLVELVWLQDFVVLANCGVFSRAAEKRNVTQPAFTRRIKKLEYAVGAQLFDRSVHPVILTEAGQTFLPVAKTIIVEWEKSRVDFARRAEAQGRVRIGSLQSLGVSFVPSLIQEIFPSKNRPFFQILPDNFAGCVEALMSHAVDMVICYANGAVPIEDIFSDVSSIDLERDRLIPVARQIGGRAEFSLDDEDVAVLTYGSNSFLGRVTRSILFENSGLRLRPVYEDPIGAALKTAASIGMGVAWLPERLVADDLRTGAMVDLSMDNPSLSAQLTVTAYRNQTSTNRHLETFWKRLAGRTKVTV